MALFKDKFETLSETKMDKSPKLSAAYKKIKNSSDEKLLDRIIEFATTKGVDIFKTPSSGRLDDYRKAGAVLRNSKVEKLKKSVREKNARELKEADNLLVRYVNKVTRVQRKKAKGYPISGMIGLGGVSPKMGFNALAKKVASRYSGKAVAPKYQAEYGKMYSPAEAKEVGRKVAAKVYRLQKGIKGVDETPYFS
jgi:hypothetical protein